MRRFLKIMIGVVCVISLAWQFVDCLKGDVICEHVIDTNSGGTLLSQAKEAGLSEIVANTDAYNNDTADREIASKIYVENKELLVLVNKSMPFNNEKVELVPICRGRLKVSEKMYDDLRKMLEDASDCGYSYWIASAYRDWNKQQKLVNEDVSKYRKEGMTYGEALAKTMESTAPAGYSEHETGLALDILCSGTSNMDVSQENYDANKWLRQHCSEYGFILRYPKGKDEITGYTYEPWHFRYVGKEAAKFISEKGITLEEFYEKIS